MTKDDLDAIRARLAAATPGPWENVPIFGYCTNEIRTEHVDHQGVNHEAFICSVDHAAGHAVQKFVHDADFIAHAPTDISALLAEVDRLHALELERSDKLTEIARLGQEMDNE